MYEISLFSPGADVDQVKYAVGLAQLSFEQLAKEICLRPWSPAIFKDNYRANANAERIDLFVVDVDRGCTVDEARELFKNFKHIIGLTKSHGKIKIKKSGATEPACDRFRVVLFPKLRATSDAEFKSQWFAAAARWPFIDPQCKNASRYYIPCSEIVSVNADGALIDLPLVTSSERLATSNGYARTTGTLNKKGKISKVTKDFLVEGAAPGEWHGRFFKAAMDFKEQGYDVEEARLKLTAVTGLLDETDEQQLDDVFNNREPRYGPRAVELITDWPAVIPTKNGEVCDRKHPDNLKHMIEKLGFKLRFNEMSEAIYNGDELLSDSDLNFIWGQSKRQGLDCGKDFIAAEMNNIAMTARYHPIKGVIEGTTYDCKQDYIGALFETLTFTDESKEFINTYREYLMKWLVGVVAKLYRPGSQNLVLTFVGEQGIGKSRWLSKLALWPEAFGEGACDPGNKDHELRHLTHLIWHIPELDYTTGKRETGALKDYLTRESISVRPAYGRYVRTGRSICSFAASVNTMDFLIDQTGNRRFLVLPIAAVNHVHEINMQQVFAQAKALLDGGFQYWLDFEEIGKLNELNSDFELHDRVTEAALSVVAGQDEMSALDLMGALGIESPSWSDIIRFGTVLNKRGFRRRRRRIEGKQARFYCVQNPTKPMKSMVNPTVIPIKGETD